MLYDDDGERDRLRHQLHVLARCSSATSPWPGSARTSPRPGRGCNLELTINHHYETVAADVTRLPFFNPPRKTA